MSPLPKTRAIPAGWSRYHQPTATGGMNARCTVTDPARATPGQWDETTGEYGASEPHHVLPPHPDGHQGWPCRVQAIQADEDTEQAGQASTARRYLIQLDDPGLATLPDIEHGHIVTITTATNDPHLTDVDLHVVDVQHGSERFTRDVVTVHNQQERAS